MKWCLAVKSFHEERVEDLPHEVQGVPFDVEDTYSVIMCHIRDTLVFFRMVTPN